MRPALDVSGLTKTYGGTTMALAGVDLQVEEGSIFALLGPNGAGKTTLMRILTTQLRPDSGGARVFGLDTVHEGAAIRRLAGYVPQEMSVWTDISGYENLLIYAKIYGVPKPQRDPTIKEALTKMGLDDVRDRIVSTYSGGMIRRLEIACTLLIKPKILFLDEPTIGLDPSARKVVWEELTAFKREHGATVFFNTHYMDEADNYADRIAIIDRGRIVGEGTPEELKRSIGGEVIKLTVIGEAAPQAVVDRLSGMDLVTDLTVAGAEVSLVVKDASMALPVVIEAIRERGVAVKRVTMEAPTLDDVFLKYAGTRLEEGGRSVDTRQTRRMIKVG